MKNHLLLSSTTCFILKLCIVSSLNAQDLPPDTVPLQIRQTDMRSAELSRISEILASPDGSKLLFCEGFRRGQNRRGYYYDLNDMLFTDLREDAKPGSPLDRGGRRGDRRLQPVGKPDPKTRFAGLAAWPSKDSPLVIGLHEEELVYRYDRPGNGMGVESIDLAGKRKPTQACSTPEGLEFVPLTRSGDQLSVWIKPAAGNARQFGGVFNFAKMQFTLFQNPIEENTVRLRRGHVDRVSTLVCGRSTPVAVLCDVDSATVLRPGIDNLVVPFPNDLAKVEDYCFINDDHWLLFVGNGADDTLGVWIFNSTSGEQVERISFNSSTESEFELHYNQNAPGSDSHAGKIVATTAGHLFAITMKAGPVFFEVRNDAVAQIASPVTHENLSLLGKAECWRMLPEGKEVVAIVQNRERNECQAVLLTMQSLIDREVDAPVGGESLQPIAEIPKPPQNESPYSTIDIQYPYHGNFDRSIFERLSEDGRFLITRTRLASLNNATNVVEPDVTGDNYTKLGHYTPVIDLMSNEVIMTIEKEYPVKIGPFAAKIGDPAANIFKTANPRSRAVMPSAATPRSFLFSQANRIGVTYEQTVRNQTSNWIKKFDLDGNEVEGARELSSSASMSNAYPTLKSNHLIYENSGVVHIFDIQAGQYEIPATKLSRSVPQARSLFDKGGVTISPDMQWVVGNYDRGLLVYPKGTAKSHHVAIALPPVHLTPDRKIAFVSNKLVFVFDSANSEMSLVDITGQLARKTYPTKFKLVSDMPPFLHVAGNGQYVCCVVVDDSGRKLACVKIDKDSMTIDGVWQAEPTLKNSVDTFDVKELVAAPNAPIAVIAIRSANNDSTDKHVVKVDLDRLTALEDAKSE